MKFKLINAWVTYAVASADSTMFHASLVVHQCEQDAIDFIKLEADKDAHLDYDYDGAETIGASVTSGDETLHAALIPANSKYNRNVV